MVESFVASTKQQVEYDYVMKFIRMILRVGSDSNKNEDYSSIH